MFTNPVDNVHDFVVLFRAMSTNPVDNIYDFVFFSVLCLRAFGSLPFYLKKQSRKKQTSSLSAPADDYNVTVEYESLQSITIVNRKSRILEQIFPPQVLLLPCLPPFILSI